MLYFSDKPKELHDKWLRKYKNVADISKYSDMFRSVRESNLYTVKYLFGIHLQDLVWYPFDKGYPLNRGLFYGISGKGISAPCN